MVTFAVVTRPGHALSISDKRIVRLSARGKGISSTTVRALVRQGRPVHRLIPAEVRRYILRKGLYRGARIYA
jgi:nicotinic acid mononucleotide adenylyltransferase